MPDFCSRLVCRSKHPRSALFSGSKSLKNVELDLTVHFANLNSISPLLSACNLGCSLRERRTTRAVIARYRLNLKTISWRYRVHTRVIHVKPDVFHAKAIFEVKRYGISNLSNKYSKMLSFKSTEPIKSGRQNPKLLISGCFYVLPKKVYLLILNNNATEPTPDNKYILAIHLISSKQLFLMPK